MTEDAPQTPANTTAEKPERNPTEKLIVRILIIAMLILVVVEAHAKLGYSSTLSKLEQAIQLDEQGEPLTTDKVPSLITGFPTKTVHENMSYTYRWTSLIKSYGINVSYDNENHVTGLVTDLAPEIPVEEFSNIEEMVESEEPGAEPGRDRMRGDRPRNRREVERPTNDDTAISETDTSPAEGTAETNESPAFFDESPPPPAAN